MPLGPHELNDVHWDKILTLIRQKTIQLNVFDPSAVIQLFKQFWTWAEQRKVHP